MFFCFTSAGVHSRQRNRVDGVVPGGRAIAFPPHSEHANIDSSAPITCSTSTARAIAAKLSSGTSVTLRPCNSNVFNGRKIHGSYHVRRKNRLCKRCEINKLQGGFALLSATSEGALAICPLNALRPPARRVRCVNRRATAAIDFRYGRIF